MPNISKTKYDDLIASQKGFETVKRVNDELIDERAVLKAQIENFNTILGKIERVARGQSMMEMTLVNQWSGATTGNAWAAPLQPGERPSGERPSDEELRRQELADLHYQITRLESQMAAVAAIAEFAKQHKA